MAAVIRVLEGPLDIQETALERVDIGEVPCLSADHGGGGRLNPAAANIRDVFGF